MSTKQIFFLVLFFFIPFVNGYGSFVSQKHIEGVLRRASIDYDKDIKTKNAWLAFITTVANEVKKTMPEKGNDIELAAKELSTKQIKKLAAYYYQNSSIVASAIRRTLDAMPAEQAIEIFYAMNKSSGKAILNRIGDTLTHEELVRIMHKLQQKKSTVITFREVRLKLKKEENEFSENIETAISSFAQSFVEVFEKIGKGFGSIVSTCFVGVETIVRLCFCIGALGLTSVIIMIYSILPVFPILLAVALLI
jgi:hypothetical protein